MSETVIPKVRQETRRVKIVFELKKDLQEDEVICEHCHGTGLEIADNRYGIRGDITHVGVRFPYKNQSLTFCRFCINGVLRKCPSCGSVCNRTGKCPCGCDEKEREERLKKESDERWEKADKIPLEEAWSFGCLYVDDVDRYVFNEDELDDLIEEYELENPRIYGTVELGIQIDAVDVIEGACNGLHEDAASQCDAKGLQAIIDEWGKKQTGATTYVPHYRMGVLRTAKEGEKQ